MVESERMEAERLLALAEETLRVFEESIVEEVPNPERALDQKAVITTSTLSELTRLTELRDAALAHLNRLTGG